MSERLLSTVSQLDSGYFTFTSSCPPSPTKSMIILDPLDSPPSDHEISSPARLTTRTFQSALDYEHYRTTRKHVDILTQLFHRNAYHLIDGILKNLSEKEFRHCLNVSEQWKFIIDDYLLRQHRKTVKRILFDTDENTSPVTNDKLTSTPMQTITNLTYLKVRIPWNIDTNHAEKSPIRSKYNYPPENDIHLAASSLSFRYGYLKYLHGPTIPKRCPICAFVSIVDVNDQHGICTNPLCRNSFCQCCSGPYHASSPCKPTTGPIRSPWRKRVSISPIFSNKTRSNLRRLLMH